MTHIVKHLQDKNKTKDLEKKKKIPAYSVLLQQEEVCYCCCCYRLLRKENGVTNGYGYCFLFRGVQARFTYVGNL